MDGNGEANKGAEDSHKEEHDPELMLALVDVYLPENEPSFQAEANSDEIYTLLKRLRGLYDTKLSPDEIINQLDSIVDQIIRRYTLPHITLNAAQSLISQLKFEDVEVRKHQAYLIQKLNGVESQIEILVNFLLENVGSYGITWDSIIKRIILLDTRYEKKGENLLVSKAKEIAERIDEIEKYFKYKLGTEEINTKKTQTKEIRETVYNLKGTNVERNVLYGLKKYNREIFDTNIEVVRARLKREGKLSA